MRPEDVVRLKHMLEAAEAVVEVIDDHRREDLDHHLTLRLALVRALEILGEAASGVSKESRRSLPDIPWTEMVGMRNRLIHAYFDIDYEIVWRTATEEIPALLPILRQANEAE